MGKQAAAAVPELSEFEKAELDLIKAQKKRDELFKDGKKEAIKNIKILMAKFGITAKNLAGEVKIKEDKPQTGKIEAGKTFKFENETWISGKRGKRPLWVSQAIENGTLENLEVK